MRRLVERWGRTGFALAASALWGLPLAVWAGAFDIGPPRRWPWVFFWIGLALMVVWAGLVAWAAGVPVPASARGRRFDLGAMSVSERRWYAVLFVCGTGLVGWLNAAATVDGGALVRAAAAGGAGAGALLGGVLALLAGLVIGTAVAWRRANAAFLARTAAD